MKHRYINLKPYFNKRRVYPSPKEFDLTDACYDERDFQFGEVGKDGIFARLERKEDLSDHTDCAGQIVEVNGLPCDSVVIVGTCCWGHYKEKFELRFADGSVDYAKAAFYDWYWPVESAVNGSLELDADELADYSHILRKQKKSDNEKEYCFLYYYKTDLNIKGRQLTTIAFPDNMFMDIFAVTVYEEE